MEGEHPERMECFKCKRKRSMREKTLKRPFLEEEPRKRKRSRNGTLVIEERNGEDRVPEKMSIEEEEEPWRQMKTYIEDEEDQVSETYKEDERPVEEEPEKPSIEEEEDPWRPMKIFVNGIIEHLHDDLENQWNLRMEQNIGVGLDLPRVEMDEGEEPPPELPEDFKVRIREMNGTRPILVLEKQLFKTDINEGENRLSMPLNQIRREFLSEEEKMRVVEGMQVKLIQPSLEETTVTFKKWKMKESCHLYVFTREWKLIVNNNSLGRRTRIQVWSFRVGSELWFALVRVNP
ncbi:putative B3 domain-containing protein At3g24850 [Vitis riparia]|uniref:putative B3 domain-containing protein At3g24850 n=1 Tax=Vitis riparia TaxID=96939 RepID=UPI00155B3F5E|nr:putative B3 domain-containing protein At3g24850 [Vitis riparia]